jgi:hypothetical protein
MKLKAFAMNNIILLKVVSLIVIFNIVSCEKKTGFSDIIRKLKSSKVDEPQLWEKKETVSFSLNKTKFNKNKLRDINLFLDSEKWRKEISKKGFLEYEGEINFKFKIKEVSQVDNEILTIKKNFENYNDFEVYSNKLLENGDKAKILKSYSDLSVRRVIHSVYGVPCFGKNKFIELLTLERSKNGFNCWFFCEDIFVLGEVYINKKVEKIEILEMILESMYITANYPVID